MTRAALLCLFALLLAGHAAQAQESAPIVHDVPPGPGTIRGRVVHQEGQGHALAGVRVILYALTPTGLPGLREGVTDPDGRFAFENVSNDPNTPYLVGAEYQGVAYSGSRLAFAPDQLEREVEIRVADVTAETREVSLLVAQLRIDWMGGRLRVSESLTIHNASSRTVYVPAEERSTRPPAISARLLEGAGDFRMSHGIEPEGVEQRDGEVFFWGPVYPGPQDLSFSYTLPVSGQKVELDAVFPSGAERIEVLVPVGGPELSASSLEEAAPRVIEGRSYRLFEASALAPGGRLAITLDLPEARVDPDALELAEARLLLSLDDAVLEVRETHVLSVKGETGVMAAPGESLLQIQLPPGSENLRYASDAAGLTLDRLPDAGLALGGIAPPGESTLELDYRIPIGGSSVDLVRSFARKLPLLGIYIADTGRLVPESDRLHRRRPVLTQDRTYIHLEAFNVAPGEQVALRLSSRPPSRRSSEGAVLVFVLLAGVLTGALLIAPLRGGAVGSEAAHAEEPASVREREAIYAAIRDLEHDNETGKIAKADYVDMRDELRSRAVALLRNERRRGATTAPADIPPTPACPSCSSAIKPTDRFCSRCGEALSVGPRTEAQG